MYWISKSKSKDFWVLSDARGKVFKLNISDWSKDLIFEKNSGKFNGIAASDSLNMIASVGDDSEVRLWDFVNKREFYHRQFYARATCIEWLKTTN